MAKYPALPLFTDAFISDTTHLTAAQTGAYLMLLMAAWRMEDCKLPDDDKMLARLSRMDKRTWAANRDIVMSFWRLENGKFYQRRLLDERKYVDDVRNKNARAGTISALKRNERHSTVVQPDVNVNSTPTPTPTPTPIKKNMVPAAIVRPHDVSERVWEDHLKARRAKRQPITETALEGMRAQADILGWTLEKALIESCQRGWASFKAEWVTKETKLNGKSKLATEADALLERIRSGATSQSSNCFD